MKQFLLLAALLITAGSCTKEKTNPKYDYRCQTTAYAYKYVGTNNGGAPFWQVHTWDTLYSADTNKVAAFVLSRATTADSIIQIHSNPDSFAAYRRTCKCYRQTL